MNTTVTMTIEDIMNSPIKPKTKLCNKNKNHTISDVDCPIQSKEDLAKFRPLKEVKPELYKKIHAHSEQESVTLKYAVN